MSLTSVVETITPELAKVWLGTSPGNRNITPQKVAGYARDMKAGRWDLTGEAIQFDINGSLRNGHHRLNAIIDSNMSVQSLIVRGIAEAAVWNIDRGRSRSISDQLVMSGELDGTTLAPAIMHITIMANAGRRNASAATMTSVEARQILEVHPNLRRSAEKCRLTFLLKSSMMTAIHYIGCYQGFSDQADKFVDVMKTGVPAYEHDPCHLLRERLIRASTSNLEMRRNDKLKLICLAWNAFAQNRPLSHLKVPDHVTIPGWNNSTLFGREMPMEDNTKTRKPKAKDGKSIRTILKVIRSAGDDGCTISSMILASGLTQNGVGSVINKLVDHGSIEKISRGVYRLIPEDPMTELPLNTEVSNTPLMTQVG